jgi:hypothetical protein
MRHVALLACLAENPLSDEPSTNGVYSSPFLWAQNVNIGEDFFIIATYPAPLNILF